MGKIYAYLRKSTDHQNTENQQLAIYKYAEQRCLKIDRWFDVGCSSRKSTKERRIDEMLEILNEKDTLIVAELSRLGRSVGQILSLIDQLMKEKIKVISLKENIRLAGKQDLQSKIMVTMISLFAEIERDLISQRTKAALATKRAAGVRLGRPSGPGKSKLDDRKAEILEFLELGVTKKRIAEKMGTTVGNLHHWIRKRGLK